MSKKLMILLFLGVGVAVAATQSALLFGLRVGVGDQYIWSQGAADLASGKGAFELESNFYIHPGTTVLYPAAELMRFGIGQQKAIQLVTVLYIALGVACLVLLAYHLRPKRLWWAAIAVWLLFDTRFLGATPVSAMAALLVGILFLLLWLNHEHPYSWRIPALVGICLGVLLGTRLDTALFMIVLCTPLIMWQSRWRSLATLLAGVGTAAVCNPYLWGPFWYLHNTLAQIHTFKGINSSSFGYAAFISLYASAFISLALSLHTQSNRSSTHESRVPSVLYRWLLLTTALATVALLLAPAHPLRYFLPFYFPWEILLPLWLYAVFTGRGFSPREQDYLMLICTMILLPLRLTFLLFVPWVF